MTVFTKTFGCQQNESDTELIRGKLISEGNEITEDLQSADLVIVNTCAVRENAENRAFGYLGELTHWKKRGRKIWFTGCMAKEPAAAEHIRAHFPHVDEIVDIDALLSSAEPLRASQTRALVTIARGCDNFCSYCIVPHVRGRERSLPREKIIAECETAIAAGYKEIMLLGQNVNSYKPDFVGLLRDICAIPGEFWVRFMTSHPKDCDERLLQLIAEEPHMAKGLHLPVQSGSDRILSVMNRKYNTEHYVNLADRAKTLCPDIVLTSDIIVGFPGESDEDFQKTLDMISYVRFDSLFTFIYSPRKGTPAADMTGVEGYIKTERMQRLLAIQNVIALEKHEAYVGREIDVLTDGREPDNPYPLSARTSGGRLVRLTGEGGGFRRAKITRATPWNLFGEVI